MSDLVGKLAKPITEALEKVATKAPAAMEAGHAKIAEALKKAVEHTKATDDALAGTASKDIAAETKAAATADAETAAKDSAESAAASAAKSTVASDAEKAAADKAKAEAEKAAADKAKADATVKDLRTTGHGPQRHLDPDDATLQKRLGTTSFDKDGNPKIKAEGPNIGHVTSKDQIDPATGTVWDADHPGKKHLCGPYSTKFKDPTDMDKVDAWYRDYIAKHGAPPATKPKVEDIFGPDGASHMTGWYKNPKNPSEYLPVDFTGGDVFALYKPDGAGGWKNTTMFPSPAPGRHP